MTVFQETLDSFWNIYYEIISKKAKHIELLNKPLYVDDSIIPDATKSFNNERFKADALMLLHDYKKKTKDIETLTNLQLMLEELTQHYSFSETLYDNMPELIKLLISPEKISAREYLQKNSKLLSDREKSLINSLSQYQIEGMIIHVLASIFNGSEKSPIIRDSTLVDHLLGSFYEQLNRKIRF